MASTSVSSVQKSFKYDVFLSFRGEDTRKSFVDHLYHALKRKSIGTYRDDEGIKKGERIDEQLIRLIEESRFYVIVFSKNYASSSWCLDELAKIIQCQKTKERTAYPVFYDVEPTEVRKQNGAVGKSFAKHIEDKSAGNWREALREAADLAGWDLKNTFDGHEAMLIQEIVNEISLELHVTTLSANGKLVGMKKRVKNVLSSLEMDIDDFRVIGIKGIGGGGKTTLVKAVFDQISILYEGSSFVENVREISTGSRGGLKSLQEKVISDVTKDPHITKYISNLRDMLRKTMGARKVLLVLDDVDHINQLEALVGEPNWFKPGSRVIITTRDKQVLVAHGVPDNLILDVDLLSPEESNCLFNRYAFGRDNMNDGFESLSDRFVSYAAGLPLTIKVLGGFLCRKDELEWTDALERLKKIPLEGTLEVLELSFNSLEEDYKEIFLDVACFLKGWKKEEAIRVLESCGFHAITGLKVLEQKSIITVSDEGCLSMHDHIKEMGKHIVRRLHPSKPYNHSRLWIEEEVKDILVEEKGTETTRCIRVQKVDPLIIMKGLRKMQELRFLMVELDAYMPDFDFSSDDIGEDSLYLPNSLQYLYWSGYRFKCLPKRFKASNLVGLELYHSNIEQLSEGRETKDLEKIRFIGLHHCKLRTLDIGFSPSLERLKLEYCDNLDTLDLSWAQNLNTLDISDCLHLDKLQLPAKSSRLKFLSISDCKLDTVDIRLYVNLERLMLRRCVNLDTLDLLWAQNLDTLDISNCQSLEKLHLPVKSSRLKFLRLSHCDLDTLDLSRTHNLDKLDILDCWYLVKLHMPITSSSLIHVNLNSLKNLKTLDLTSALNLKSLEVHGCKKLVKLHMPVECFKLESLELYDTPLRTLDLAGARNLVSLNVKWCGNLVELHMPVESVNLESLKLLDTKLRTLDLMGAWNLVSLNVKWCKNMVELHMPVESVKLKSLELHDTMLRYLDLAGAQNLTSLKVKKCKNLVKLGMYFKNAKLKSLDPYHFKLRSLDLTSAHNLDTFALRQCESLVESHATIESLSLHQLDLKSYKLQTLNLKSALNLKCLNLKCYNLVEIHAPIIYLKDDFKIVTQGNRCHRLHPFLVNQGSPMLLAELHLIVKSKDIACELHPDNYLHDLLFSCIYKEPLSLSSNLRKYISVDLCTCTVLASFYESSRDLQCLRRFTLEGGNLEVLEKLHQLECLEELNLVSRVSEHLPDSICMLKHLKSLKITSCWLLKQLPEDLGRLECLEELHLTDCDSLRDIPESMCEMKLLRSLHIKGCVLVEKLPKEIGRLKCLRELYMMYTGIRELPQSVFQLKGLRITAAVEDLESYGITHLEKISEYSGFGFI